MGKKSNNLLERAKNFSEKEIFEALDKLKSLDLCSSNINEVKELVRPLLKCGFSTVTYPAGKLLFRGRVLEPNEKINEVSKISYPPLDKIPVLNRASSSNYQIFYGAVSRELKGENLAEATVTFEISKIYEPDFNSHYELIGMGYWLPSEKFTVASIGLHSEIAKNNSDALSISKVHNEIAEGIPEMTRAISAVTEFISGEFSKSVESGNNHEYLISAAYGDLIFELGFAAIMYPSVKLDGHAFNIALRQDLVDSILQCKRAYILKMRLIKGKAFWDYHLISWKINSNNTFNWETPPPEGVISNAQRKLIEAEIDKYGEFENTNWVLESNGKL